MGERIARSVAASGADCIVPVPLHKNSRRNYNQARLIAEGAGGVWGIPVISVLAWSRDVSRQATKMTEERLLPDDAIIAAKNAVPYRKVCLTDDVYTTGSTLRAAASALERAGRTVAAVVVWSVS
jgi:predicted amidophosphoribosyltransferase